MIAVLLVGLTLFNGPTTPLVGTVVEQDGKPVVGAELVLTGSKPGESPVVARAKAGDRGRFRLDRPAELAAIDRYMVPTLWAIAPGHRVAVIRFAGAMPGPAESIRISLGAPAKTKVRVESPEGAPIAGARLSVQKTAPDWLTVPDPVADLAERVTGSDGVATLEAFGPDQIGWVDVIARGYGIQPRWLDPYSPEPKRVALKPVTALSGRLVPETGVGPKLARDVEVPAGPAQVEVAAIELMRAAPALRGEVHDEAGRPVAAAEIAAEWIVSADGKSEGYATQTTADAGGGFALEGLAPGVRAKITARHRDRATVKPIEAAIATIEDELDPGSRARDFLALADAVPVRDRARRGEFLGRAFAEAIRVSSAETKLGALREIADRWLDLGDIIRATPILREGQAVIAAMPTQYRVFRAEQFGEVLAAIDLPAAQAVFEAKGRVSPPDDRQVRQHLGEAAVRIAPFNPAEAERLSKDDSRSFQILAAYDPRAITTVISKLPAAARRTERSFDGAVSVAPEALARLAGGELLGMPIEARRRAAIEKSGVVATELPSE